MRIRKSHGKASSAEAVRPIVGPLLKVWDVEDIRPKSTTMLDIAERRIIKTKPVMEPAASGLESMSALSGKQSPPPGVSMLLKSQGHVEHAGADGGSSLSVDQVSQVQDGEEHVMRHYVRRSSKGGAPASALVQVEEPSVVAARMSTLENVALQINGNEGINEQGEESKELPTKITMPPPSATGACKSNLNLVVTESDSEDQETHPSTAPEGSLLHSLYLQLLAAGSEGMTLRALFTSFKKQTALASFASDWKDQVRSHLKNNPHFDEVKGQYLLCDDQLDVQQEPKRSPANMCVSPGTPDTSGRHVPPLSTTLQSDTDHSAPAAVQPTLLVENNEGIQTRRKAYEKTIEAVLTQSAMEFRNMQQSPSNMQMASSVADPSDSQPTTHMPLPTSSRKRKPSSVDNEELDNRRKPIRGALQAMQAQILAETRVQEGVRCARKEDAKHWRCPMMAMAGYTLCKHHRTLQLKKRAKNQKMSKSRRSAEEEPEPETGRTIKSNLMQSSTEKEGIATTGLGGAHATEAPMNLQPKRVVSSNTSEAEDHAARTQGEEETEEEALIKRFVEVLRKRATEGNEPSMESPTPEPHVVHRNRASPGYLKAMHAKIIAEKGVQSGVRCARKDKSNDSVRKWQCPMYAVQGQTLCEHHIFLKEKKKARYAAAQQKKKAAAKVQGNTNMSLPVNQTDLDQVPVPVPVPLPPRPSKSSRISLQDTVSDTEKVDHTESTDTDEEHNVDDEPAHANSKGDDDQADSNAEPQMLKSNAPKRRYVAARKTAANVGAVKVKSQGRETAPLIRPPTIPPLQAMNGVRRKAVKNRSLLLL